MIVNSQQAVELITNSMKAGLTTMMHGAPGIGKSSIVRDIADKYKLEMIDVRLSQCDPVDLLGFPAIQGDLATYVPMDIFPTTRTVVPKGKNGFLLFLDEINSAPLSVQAASYKLILDKTVGQHKLHPKTVIVAAGNLITDGAITNRMSTATQSRLVHLELGVDAKQWIIWAAKNNLDHRVVSYIENNPDNLHKFDPNHNDHTFPSPRTWEFVSKLLKVIGSKPLMTQLALLAGTIGEGEARQFIIYTETLTKLPSIQSIIQNPTGAILNEEPAMLFAVGHLIAAHAKKSNIDALMQYTGRMSLEYETITLQNILRREPTLIDEPVIQDWITVKGQELFDDDF